MFIDIFFFKIRDNNITPPKPPRCHTDARFLDGFARTREHDRRFFQTNNDFDVWGRLRLSGLSFMVLVIHRAGGNWGFSHHSLSLLLEASGLRGALYGSCMWVMYIGTVYGGCTWAMYMGAVCGGFTW